MEKATWSVPRVFVFSVAALFHGCTTLGPNFVQPQVPWLDEWDPDLYGQRVNREQVVELDLRFWWKAFDDPVLNELIETARRENPTLRLAGLRVLEARALLGVAGSSLYPQVQQLGGSYNYVNTEQRGGATGNSNDSFGSYQAAFNLGWELDFWGRFRRAIESADAAFFASVANQQDAQVLLSAQVADLYFTYRTLEQRIETARRNAEIQRRSYEITERVYREGQQAELDLQQARTQYLSTLATIPALQLSLTKTLNAVGALLGRAPGDLRNLAQTHRALPDVDKLLIEGVPARLLARRPDVRAVLWQVAAQSAQIGIAEADYYPAFFLNGSIGWSGNTLGATADTGSLVIGPAFRWNLFDHGAIANNIRVQDARLQQLVEQYRNVVLQAAREIDDAAISVVKNHEQMTILVETVAAAKRALSLANVRYQEGYSGFQRVLDAQRAYFAQTDRVLGARGALISSVISLYKALGGGWLEPDDTRQILPGEITDAMRERTDWGDMLDQPLPPGTITPSSYPEAVRYE